MRAINRLRHVVTVLHMGIALLVKHFVKLVLIAFIIVLTHQYFHNFEAFNPLIGWYKNLEEIERLQLWMIGTMIMGFVLNYFTAIRVAQNKKLLDVKVAQVEAMMFLVQRMNIAATETAIFCKEVIRFKQRIDYEKLPDDQLAFFAGILRNKYIKYLESRQTYSETINHFYGLSNVHNVTYMRCRQYSKLTMIPKAFNNEIVLPSLEFELYFDVNNLGLLVDHISRFKYERLSHIAQNAERCGIWISAVAGEISWTLTKELQAPTWKFLVATFKNAEFLLHSRQFVKGHREIELFEAAKFIRDLEK